MAYPEVCQNCKCFKFHSNAPTPFGECFNWVGVKKKGDSTLIHVSEMKHKTCENFLDKDLLTCRDCRFYRENHCHEESNLVIVDHFATYLIVEAFTKPCEYFKRNFEEI